MITRKVITDNSQEIISVYWDETRFALLRYDKVKKCFAGNIPLNPREADEIAEFIERRGRW